MKPISTSENGYTEYAEPMYGSHGHKKNKTGYAKRMGRRVRRRVFRLLDRKLIEDALDWPGRTIRRDEPFLTPSFISNPPRMEVYHFHPIPDHCDEFVVTQSGRVIF